MWSGLTGFQSSSQIWLTPRCMMIEHAAGFTFPGTDKWVWIRFTPFHSYRETKECSADWKTNR